jgi:hypothetical protein
VIALSARGLVRRFGELTAVTVTVLGVDNVEDGFACLTGVVIHGLSNNGIGVWLVVRHLGEAAWTACR